MTTAEIKLVLKDRATKNLKGVNAEVGKLGKSSKGLFKGAGLKDFNGNLLDGIQNTGVMNGKLGGLLGQMKGIPLIGNPFFLFTAGAGVATASIITISKEMGDLADKLLDLELMTGLNTTQLQLLDDVAVEAGVSVSTITSSASGLLQRMRAGGEQTKKFQGTLDALGISLTDSEGGLKSNTVLFDEVVRGLQDVEDITQRNVLATDLFGGSATQLAPVLGLTSERYAELTNQADASGKVLDRNALIMGNNIRIAYGQGNEKIKDASQLMKAELLPAGLGVANMFNNAVAPAIAGTIRWFGGLVRASVEAGAILVNGVQQIGDLAVESGRLMAGVGKNIQLSLIITGNEVKLFFIGIFDDLRGYVTGFINDGLLVPLNGAITKLNDLPGIKLPEVGTIETGALDTATNELKAKRGQLYAQLEGTNQDIQNSLTRLTDGSILRERQAEFNDWLENVFYGAGEDAGEAAKDAADASDFYPDEDDVKDEAKKTARTIADVLGDLDGKRAKLARDLAEGLIDQQELDRTLGAALSAATGEIFKIDPNDANLGAIYAELRDLQAKYETLGDISDRFKLGLKTMPTDGLQALVREYEAAGGAAEDLDRLQGQLFSEQERRTQKYVRVTVLGNDNIIASVRQLNNDLKRLESQYDAALAAGNFDEADSIQARIKLITDGVSSLTEQIEDMGDASQSAFGQVQNAADEAARQVADFVGTRVSDIQLKVSLGEDISESEISALEGQLKRLQSARAFAIERGDLDDARVYGQAIGGVVDLLGDLDVASVDLSTDIRDLSVGYEAGNISLRAYRTGITNLLDSTKAMLKTGDLTTDQQQVLIDQRRQLNGLLEGTVKTPDVEPANLGDRDYQGFDLSKVMDGFDLGLISAEDATARLQGRVQELQATLDNDAFLSTEDWLNYTRAIRDAEDAVKRVETSQDVLSPSNILKGLAAGQGYADLGVADALEDELAKARRTLETSPLAKSLANYLNFNGEEEVFADIFESRIRRLAEDRERIEAEISLVESALKLDDVGDEEATKLNAALRDLVVNLDRVSDKQDGLAGLGAAINKLSTLQDDRDQYQRMADEIETFGDAAGISERQVRALVQTINTLRIRDLLDDVDDFASRANDALGRGISSQAALAKEIEAFLSDNTDLSGEAVDNLKDLQTELEAADAQARKMSKIDKLFGYADETIGLLKQGSGLLKSMGMDVGSLDERLEGLSEAASGAMNAVKGFASGNILQGISGVIQGVAGLFKALEPQWRKTAKAIRQSLSQGVTSGVSGAISEFLKGDQSVEEFRQNLKAKVQEAMLDGMISAFIQSAVVQKQIEPLIARAAKAYAKGDKAGAKAAFAEAASVADEIADDVVNSFEGLQGFFSKAEGIQKNTIAATASFGQFVSEAISIPLYDASIRFDTATIRFEMAVDALVNQGINVNSTAHVTVNNKSFIPA